MRRKEPKRTLGRRILRACVWTGAGLSLVLVTVGVLLWMFLSRVPKAYPLAKHPILSGEVATNLGGGLNGFESPYVGHTGSWDGKGGALMGRSKIPDLECERAMGLLWTFMPVYWRAMEPDGPVDLNQTIPPEWHELDAFVIAAQERDLNVFMQAPVVGGNAGGPPQWAGRREEGKSAPANMEALAVFAGKLAKRYCPGGTLAERQGWGTNYGVRAWELDNEPESYRTHWKGQAGDYAEFVTRAASQIKAVDPEAVIVAPGLASGKSGLSWLEATLDAPALAGSPAFRARNQAYSIGPVIDVVSLHNYEGLDSAFAGEPRTIGQVLDDINAVFEKWEQRAPGFAFAHKSEYWHTEGNFDFVGALSAERRAAWRFQFFTRAFAAGIHKVVVMDASPPEQRAVHAYVTALPNPFPMFEASTNLTVVRGQVMAFCHPDQPTPDSGRVWVAWAQAGTGDAVVELPTQQERVEVITANGDSKTMTTITGRIWIQLNGDDKMAAPVLIIDRSAKAEH